MVINLGMLGAIHITEVYKIVMRYAISEFILFYFLGNESSTILDIYKWNNHISTRQQNIWKALTKTHVNSK